MIADVTGVTFLADALKGIDKIDASSSIEAWTASTVVDVFVAMVTCVALFADALAMNAFAPTTARRR